MPKEIIESPYILKRYNNQNFCPRCNSRRVDVCYLSGQKHECSQVRMLCDDCKTEYIEHYERVTKITIL